MRPRETRGGLSDEHSPSIYLSLEVSFSINSWSGTSSFLSIRLNSWKKKTKITMISEDLQEFQNKDHFCVSVVCRVCFPASLWLCYVYSTSLSTCQDSHQPTLRKHKLPNKGTVRHMYLDKEDEVLEWCIQMGLLLQLDDSIKVLVVYVGIHPEQTLQDGFGNRHEVLRKGDA